MSNFLISLALGIVSSMLQKFGLPNCREVMLALGKAFGPDGCRYWTELSAAEQAALLERVPILNTLHTDWPKPFRWVPRNLTAYVMPDNMPPPIVFGTGTIEDIPEPGTFVATRGYFALTTTTKFHVRFGFRWDRNDLYLEFPSATAKQLK